MPDVTFRLSFAYRLVLSFGFVVWEVVFLRNIFGQQIMSGLFMSFQQNAIGLRQGESLMNSCAHRFSSNKHGNVTTNVFSTHYNLKTIIVFGGDHILFHRNYISPQHRFRVMP